MSRNLLPLLRFVNDNVHTPEVSGGRVAALTTGTETEPGGRYFSNGRAICPSALSYDEALQEELWAASAGMTGLPDGIEA